MERWKRLGWFLGIWAVSVAAVMVLGQLIRLFLKP